MKRTFLYLLLACAITALSSCNTIGGMGRDIQSMGGAIESASE